MDFTFLSEWLFLIVVLAASGALAGFFSGLLGIGGGIILVPCLYYVFSTSGFSADHIMHVSVGTSLATMVLTGLSSARAHWKRQSIRVDLLKRIGSGIFVGVVLGTLIAGFVSGLILKAIFAAAIGFLSFFMFFGHSGKSLFKDVPRQPWSGLAGFIVGMFSTLMGIGGAVMNVPYMTFCGVPVHKAVGTAAALGLFISIPGTLGFVFIGWDIAGRPPFSLGYINIPAWAVIISTSVAMAPLGAKISHSLPVAPLRKIFAVLMLAVAANMFLSALNG